MNVDWESVHGLLGDGSAKKRGWSAKRGEKEGRTMREQGELEQSSHQYFYHGRNTPASSSQKPNVGLCGARAPRPLCYNTQWGGSRWERGRVDDAVWLEANRGRATGQVTGLGLSPAEAGRQLTARTNQNAKMRKLGSREEQNSVVCCMIRA